MISETNYEWKNFVQRQYIDSGDIDLNPGQGIGYSTASFLSFGKSAWTVTYALGVHCYLNP
jgi:hypothetical protein